MSGFKSLNLLWAFFTIGFKVCPQLGTVFEFGTATFQVLLLWPMLRSCLHQMQLVQISSGKTVISQSKYG